MGSGGLRVFNSVDHSIDECVSLLDRLYISKGKVALADIGAMYCPVGAANDPGGLNKNWIPGVSKIYKQITGVDYDPNAATYGGGGTDGSGGSVSGGGGGLHLEYQDAPPAPKRFPNWDYNIKFSSKVQELDLSSIGRPRQLYSPYNLVKDVPIEKTDDDEKDDKNEENSKPKIKDNKNIFRPELGTRNPDDIQWSVNYGKDLDYNEANVGPLTALPDDIGSDDYVWSFDEGAIDKDLVWDKKALETYREACFKLPSEYDRRVELEDDTNEDGEESENNNTGDNNNDGEDNSSSDKKPKPTKKKNNTKKLKLSEMWEEYKKSVKDMGSIDEAMKSGFRDALKLSMYMVTGQAKKIIDFKPEAIKQRQEATLQFATAKSMCVDMIKYSYTGRMLRAFPTYLFLIAEEGGGWIDGRKLWTNYYSYIPVVSIKIHQSAHQPIQTAHVEISNLSGSLNNKSKPYSNSKSIEDDEGYNGFVRWVYKTTGILLGSPKITQSAIDIRNEILDSINIRDGARIHIRLGYGSNPLNLPICFNGAVAETQVGDITTIVAQSDGAELVNNVIATKSEDDQNNILKYGSESSNLIGGILIERESKWFNYINDKWGESSKYGIEHFGIHLGFDNDDVDRREYDLLKNIYTATYRPVRYVNSNTLSDDEKNINMFLANKTPWDVFKTVEQSTPEFICQPMYHQFESRVFFGLPWFETSYRYDCNSSGAITEQFKSFAQFHMVSSTNSIIKNSVKTSSKDLFQNAMCVYSLGGNAEKSPVVYSDRNIDHAYQKTTVIDSTINQDYLGFDKVYEFAGLAVGKSAAVNIALSNILDSWGKTYKGEILIIGDASIKPCDYIYINDSQSRMNGVCTVRETVHSFSMETGFVSSLTPGLISHSALKDSGGANISRTLTTIGLSTAATMNARYSSMVMCSVLRPYVVLSKMIGKNKQLLSKIPELSKLVHISDDVYDSFKTGKIILKATDMATDLNKVIKSIKVLDTVKDVGSLVSKIKLGLTAASVGATSPTGPVSLLVGAAVWLATTILFDVMLNSIIDSFQYNHSVIVYPILFKEAPFLSGAKGASELVPGISETKNNRDEEIPEDDDNLKLGKNEEIDIDELEKDMYEALKNNMSKTNNSNDNQNTDSSDGNNENNNNAGEDNSSTDNNSGNNNTNNKPDKPNWWDDLPIT